MKAIFHCDRNWGIGKNNGLMFSLPKDMKFFRETTMGKVVVMGRNTFLSLPNGPLKGRINFVLSPSEVEGVRTVYEVDELLEELEDYPEDDAFVIGGASVYRELLPFCTEALVTKVDADGGADVFVPNLDLDPNFECVSESEPVEDNGYITRYCTYVNLRMKY